MTMGCHVVDLDVPRVFFWDEIIVDIEHAVDNVQKLSHYIDGFSYSKIKSKHVVLLVLLF